MIPDLIRVLDLAVERLDRLGIPYVVGGSLASSAYGEPRPSGDVDLVIDLPATRIGDLVAAFETEFYVAHEAVAEAVARGTSFNVIHLSAVVKLDLFILADRPLRRLQMDRRRLGAVDPSLPNRYYLSSAEDIILQKLDWYRKGGGVSDLQWRDVVGVLKMQRQSLDFAYLRQMASQAGLGDLLDRARVDAQGR